MFVFNKDYKDLDQVAPFWDAYDAVYQELHASGMYPYNSRFKGRIPGIEGEDEDTAIYLLQCERHRREMMAQVEAAIGRGYVPYAVYNFETGRLVMQKPFEAATQPTRFAGVVRYGWYSGKDGFAEWSDVRVVQRHPSMLTIIPKGKRNGSPLCGGTFLVRT